MKKGAAMTNRIFNQCTAWVGIGLVAGILICTLWPHEPAQAITNSRADKFEMFTAPASALNGIEGVFVMDHLTFQIRGAVLDPQQAQFTAFYFRDLKQDFPIDAIGGKPEFAVLSGRGQLQNRPGMRVQTAPGVIYVAELNSGMVVGYAFSWERTGVRGTARQELGKVAMFRFRDSDL